MDYAVTMRRAAGVEIEQLLAQAAAQPPGRRRFWGVPYGPVLTPGRDMLIGWIQDGAEDGNHLDLGDALVPMHCVMITDAEASEGITTPLLDTVLSEDGVAHLDNIAVAEMDVRLSVVERPLARARLMQPSDAATELWPDDRANINRLLKVFARFKTFMAEARAQRMQILVRLASRDPDAIDQSSLR